MRALLHACDPDLAQRWVSRLSDADFDVAIVSDPEALGEDGDFFIWVNPWTNQTAADALLAPLRELRQRLPGRLPLLLAGGPALASPERWLDAGAVDVLSDELETAELAARLQVAVWWFRKLAAGRDTVTAEWQQRLELSRRTHKSLAFGLAHDFNNLLSVIQGNVDLSLMNPSLGRKLRYNLDQISEATLRAANLARHVLDLSKADKQPSGGVNLNQALRILRGVIRESAAAAPIEFDLDEQLPPARAQVGALAEGLAILVASMSLRGEPGGVVEISTRAMPEETIALEIRCTPAPDAEPLALDTDGGLELCTELLAEGGAVLRVLGSGVACVELKAEGPAGSGGTIHREAATVLLIDAEDAVRDAAHKLLREDGYTVLEAASGEEGFELFRTIGGMLDVVILDLHVPGVQGGEVLHRMRNLRPEVRVVVWSGCTEEAARQQMNGSTDVAFLEKPAELAEFPAMLRRVLQAS